MRMKEKDKEKDREKEKDGELVIKKFLAKLNPSGWRTNRKAALVEFEKIMFATPQVNLQDASLIQLLLVGNKCYPKGLLKICGEHSVSNIVAPTLTRASIIALRLLARLLDETKFKAASFVRGQLRNIPHSTLSLPNFAHHYIRENSPDETVSSDLFETPTRVITAFLCSVPDLQLSDFILDDWARYFYLRQVLGYYTTKPDDVVWSACVLSPAFSHSMVLEFLTTSKHRMSREVWVRNLNTYLTKCKPVLRKDTMETLFSGIPKLKKKGLLGMCNANKGYSIPAKELLAQILDETFFSDAGHIADFLLERRDLLRQLNSNKDSPTAFDIRIVNLLTSRARLGDVKEALKMLHQPEEEDIENFEMVTPERERQLTISRDCSFDSLKKTFGKIKRSSFGSSMHDVLSVTLCPVDNTPTAFN